MDMQKEKKRKTKKKRTPKNVDGVYKSIAVVYAADTLQPDAWLMLLADEQINQYTQMRI